jgi:multidrug efflux pump subunit AcrB
MMPKLNNGQFQLRLDEPEGTRLEVMEDKFKQVLQIIDKTVDHHVKITSGYIGLVPSSFGSSNLYVFNTGTHEAVLQVNLDEDYKMNLWMNSRMPCAKISRRNPRNDDQL